MAVSAPSTSAPLDDPVADEMISIDCSVSSERYEDRGGICYLIRPGDSLWRIAEQIYGSPTYWRTIYDANRRRVSRRDYTILVGFGLELPLVRVALIDGVCQPCPDPSPPPDAPPLPPPTAIGSAQEDEGAPPQGTSAAPGSPDLPDFGRAIELLNPALKYDADLVTLHFVTPYGPVEVKLKGEIVLARRGSVLPHGIELSKDSIKVAYECAIKELCSKFSFDVDTDGRIVLEHEVFSLDWSWGSTSVSYVPPKSWKFEAGPKEPITLTWAAPDGDEFDVKLTLAGFEAVFTSEELATAPALVEEPSWSAERALEYGLYGLGAVAAVGLAVAAAAAAPVVVPAIAAAGAALAGAGTAQAGAVAAGAAAVLLFTTAREDFDMLEDWPVAAPDGA